MQHRGKTESGERRTGKVTMAIEIVSHGKQPCPEPDLFVGRCEKCSCELQSSTIEDDDGGLQLPPRPPNPPITTPRPGTTKYLDFYSVRHSYQPPSVRLYWTTDCPTCGHRVAMSPRWLNPAYSASDDAVDTSPSGCLSVVLLFCSLLSGTVALLMLTLV